MNFFAELKRRNVPRADAFSASGAGLLVQIATPFIRFFRVGLFFDPLEAHLPLEAPTERIVPARVRKKSEPLG